MRRRFFVNLLCVAALLAFTAPGHRLLLQVGLATACGSDSNC